MATTLEIIQGIAQAAANAHDGAHEESLNADKKARKVGLKREEGHILNDRRVIDGFKVRFNGPLLTVLYQSETRLKDVVAKGFENEIVGMIGKVASFLKKEYKRITGRGVSLTKEGDVDARMEYMNRIRCWVTAYQYFKIGGIKDVEDVKQESGDNLEKDFKKFLDQSSDKKPKNVKRKKEKDSTFMPWNMKE